MPPDSTWVYILLIAPLVLWAGPKAWEYTIRALGDAIAKSIGHALGIQAMNDRLTAIEVQLKPNGGTSLRDAVDAQSKDARLLRKQVDALSTSMHNVEGQIEQWLVNEERFDPPSGIPTEGN